MQQENGIQEKIAQLQEQYYNNNQKKSFFTSSQKLDCAKHITQNISLEELLRKTFFIKEHSNIIITDYLVFKTFANPSNYEHIVNYTIALAEQCIQNYGSYQLHVYLNSFTITAAQRHSDIIKIFCEKCFRKESKLFHYLEKMYIYNYPSVISAIRKLFTPFMDKEAIGKVQLVSEKV